MEKEKSALLGDEFIDILCGDKIGEGISREVFKCRLRDDWIVKVEREGSWHQNIREYAIWEEVRYWKKMSKWFAPCEYISPHGLVLIQKKVTPAYKKDLPEKIPAFFTDVKEENFGMLDGKLVCFDYGTTPISRNWSTKLKKVTF